MQPNDADNSNASAMAGDDAGLARVEPTQPILTPPPAGIVPSPEGPQCISPPSSQGPPDSGNDGPESKAAELGGSGVVREAGTAQVNEADLSSHPLADLFPMLQEEAFGRFKEDIRTNGQQAPIIVHEGYVLDGRNRLRACKELGIVPIIKEWSGEAGSPEAFVIAANLNRRHLSQSQKALSAARLLVHREKQGSTEGGTVARDGARGRENFPNLRKSSEEVAQLFSISHKSVEIARRLVLQGSKELIDLVDAGVLAVSAAAQVVDLPSGEQQQLVTGGLGAIREAAKQAREQNRKKRRRKKRGRKAQKLNAGAFKHVTVNIREQDGQYILKVGADWQVELASAMADTSAFERYVKAGLRVVWEEPPCNSPE